MQTSSFFHPLTPPGVQFSGTLRQYKPSSANYHNRMTLIMAIKKDGPNGKMVDENMIVLRERIRKMKAEMDTESDRLPDNWMEWEKTYTYSGAYHSNVYEAVALLQRFLMESRPSVALGLVAAFALSGSTMAVVVLQWLLNSVQGN